MGLCSGLDISSSFGIRSIWEKLCIFSLLACQNPELLPSQSDTHVQLWQFHLEQYCFLYYFFHGHCCPFGDWFGPFCWSGRALLLVSLRSSIRDEAMLKIWVQIRLIHCFSMLVFALPWTRSLCVGHLYAVCPGSASPLLVIILHTVAASSVIVTFNPWCILARRFHSCSLTFLWLNLCSHVLI